jgi:hypothetical protein
LTSGNARNDLLKSTGASTGSPVGKSKAGADTDSDSDANQQTQGISRRDAHNRPIYPTDEAPLRATRVLAIIGTHPVIMFPSQPARSATKIPKVCDKA